MTKDGKEIGGIYSEEEINAKAILDKKALSEKWAQLYEKLCETVTPALAEDICRALKEFYTIYKKEAVNWIGELYDPEYGGFYYSNSARDNTEVECEGKIYKLLPDLESTKQAFGYITESHMADEFDKDIKRALPEWVGDRLIPFIKEMQDERTGYFYHPQWGKERIDKWQSRRGRDLLWAVRMLEQFGEAPTYNTPLEERSESKNNGSVETTEHLRNKESFLAYLDSLGFDPKNAYSAYVLGNRLEAQVMEICARDRELEKEGADYRLISVMKEWLDQRFNPETGAWTEAEFSHDTVNGILKIASTYIRAGLPLPDPILSIKAAIRCVTLDKTPEHVCCVLNPWYAINTIISDIKATSCEGDDALSIADKIHEEVMESYPEMIRKTAENLKIFLKDDGSFSYFADRSSHYSQMMPVAIPNTNEGDVNATMICGVAIPGHIFKYLGVSSIPIFTESDRMRLMNILQRKYDNYKEGKRFEG